MKEKQEDRATRLEVAVDPEVPKAFSPEDLLKVWNVFAEQRKIYQAEYQLLTQPIDQNENEIIVHLHNPVQETILNTLKGDITAFIRKHLQNSSITIRGELRQEETKKMMYTNREKFEYLLQKNPALKDLKDRLGLDTDF